VLKIEHALPLERWLKFSRQLCEALAAAHAEGVVHRDFKPHNVLVGKDDQVYVSDFGLATSFETAKMGMTRSGAIVGTPNICRRNRWKAARWIIAATCIPGAGDVRNATGECRSPANLPGR